MKKILSFVMAIMMCVGIACPVQATTYEEASAEYEMVDGITPREFVRQYENYYVIDGPYVLVVQDPNYDIFDDRHITVSLVTDDGPTAFDVVVYSKKDGASEWETISSGKISQDGTAASFSIKENYTFKVMAQATAGKNGNATIQVVLT